MVLSRIFGPKSEEVRGEWRKWSELPTKYGSGDQIEKKERGGACSMYGERCIRGFSRET